jgi:uncharacterized membrane protein (UPF0127 family)
LANRNKVENPFPFTHSEAMIALRIPSVLLAVLLSGCGGGCNKPAAPATVPSGSPSPALPTQAQPKLQTMKLWLGSEEMIAELALAPVQQMTGMMFRTNMAANAGMLFPLPYTQRASFWMKNCPLPLSAAYIDPEGVIQEIHNLQPHNTNSVVSASANIRFVLETPQGWFETNHISVGAVVRAERGTLMETFFGNR